MSSRSRSQSRSTSRETKLDSKREKIFKFISKHLTEDEYQDAIEKEAEWASGSYRKFLARQKSELNKVSDQFIGLLEKMIMLINDDALLLCDKETMTPFEADGFIISDGKLIFTNSV